MILPNEEARDYARQQVEWYRSNPIDLMGVPVRYLDETSGEEFAAEVFARMLAAGMIDPDHALRQAGEGEPLFYDALCLLAAFELEREIELIATLRAAVIVTLRSPPHIKRARRRETNVLRDICLTMLVQDVRDRFNLPVISSSARRESACGVVGHAMGMTADAVRKATRYFIKDI